MHHEIADVLKADAELNTLLVGGIYDTVTEISRQNTPAAFNANKELLPCLLVKAGTLRQTGLQHDSHAQTIEMYLYERSGLATIEQAERRIYDLLHNKRIEPPTGNTAWRVKNTFVSAGLEDQALNSSLTLLRYEALLRRV